MSGPSKSKHKFIFYILPIILLFVSNDVTAVTKSSTVINRNATNISTIASQIKSIIKKYPNLLCGIYVCPLNNKKDIININGDTQFPAASLIKLPVAVALLKKIDKKEISWNEVLVLKRHHYAQGAGFIRTRRAGTKIKLREVFRLMLTISDNTATNMIIDRLGGVNAAHREIVKLGFKNTKLVNWLGDFKGTNKTSPHDLVELLEKSLEGNLLNNDSKRILRSTLFDVANKSLIKRGLGKYTKFAHKTGTIGICVGDAGIMYLPWGKKIGISIIVKRPFNSLNGQKVIREISSLVYKQIK